MADDPASNDPSDSDPQRVERPVLPGAVPLSSSKPFAAPIADEVGSGEQVVDRPIKDPREGRVPWRWLDVGMVVGGLFVGMLFVLFVAWLLFRDQFQPNDDEPVRLAVFILLGCGFYLSLLLATFWRTIGRGATWEDLGCRWPSSPWFALVGPLFVLQIGGATIINVVLMRVLGAFDNPQAEAFGAWALEPLGFAGIFAVVAILAPIAEEIFFRGMVYPLLHQRYTLTVTVILNAALFSVVHMIPLLLPGLFFIGCVLTWVRARSESIYPSICLHMLQNGLAVWAITSAMG